MLLFGVSVFQCAVVPEAVARGTDRPLRAVAKVAAIVLLVTAIGWLLLTAGDMGEGWTDVWNPSLVGSVVLDTDFGRVWLWRMAAVVLVVVLAFARNSSWLVVAVVAALVLGSLGLVGHALVRSGDLGWLTQASFVAHVLAAGFWLGALAALVASLGLSSDEAGIADKTIALQRFSRLGYSAVTIVLVTGAFNTWSVLGALPLDGSSPYQTLLLAKVALVMVMVALALANRFVLMPRLQLSKESLRTLRRSAAVELLAGLGAVGLVGMIGNLPPG